MRRNEIFGKNFIRIVFLSSVSLLLPTAYATSQHDYTKAVEYAYQRVLDAHHKLDEKAGLCQKKEISASNIKGKLPIIPDDKTRQKIAVAIAYLSNRNYFRCIYHEEAGLLFQIHSYEQLILDAKESGFNVNDPYKSDYSGVRKSGLGLMPLNSLNEVEYMALPEATRKQLESIPEMNTQSFNVIKLLDDLGLLKDVNQNGI